VARRTFDVIDVVEILEHWHAGRSKMAIAASVGVDRETVRRYVAPAFAAGIRPGGPRLSRVEWAGLVAGWFPRLVDAKARSLTFPVINEHRDRVESMLKTNTVTTVHQRLRDEHKLMVSIASFRRYVRLEFPGHVDESAVTVLRPLVEPGTEAQIDYGFLGPWVDPVTHKARRVWAFVMVLACCRHMFVRPVLRMDIHAWIAAHVAAFEYFGCVPARLVPDNLKTGVITADVFDPKLNRAYAEMAEHYGCLIDPARALKPKDKPRVERPMPYIRDSFWRGRTWASVDQMQTVAVEWTLTTAGRRAHRGLDGAAPVAMFEAVSRPAMRALPHHQFEIAAWSRPKVAVDCHVSVAGVLYSVPWRHVGTHLDVRLTERRMEAFSATTLVKSHPRAERGRVTDMADYPPDKIAFFQRTPVWCRHQADLLGVNVAEVINELLAVNVLHRLRSAQGIVRLADKHSPARLDAACRRAIEVGDPTYRTIKGILAAGTEHDGQPQPDAAPTAPAHLHGPDRLFNPDLANQPEHHDIDIDDELGIEAVDGEHGQGEVA
jgi:transposase